MGLLYDQPFGADAAYSVGDAGANPALAGLDFQLHYLLDRAYSMMAKKQLNEKLQPKI